MVILKYIYKKALFSVDGYLHLFSVDGYTSLLFKKGTNLWSLSSEKEETESHLRSPHQNSVLAVSYISYSTTFEEWSKRLCDYLHFRLSQCLPHLCFSPFFCLEAGKFWDMITPLTESPADLSGNECCLRRTSNVAAHLTEIGWGTEKHLDHATCNICLFWHQPSAQKTVCLKGKNKARK